MKLPYLRLSIAGPLLIAGLLAGCATSQDSYTHHPHHNMHHPNTTAGAAPTMMNRSADGKSMKMMDMHAMCDAHKKMMNAKTPEERQSMMAECGKMMPPEMMQRRMQMMQEQCK